MLSLTDQELFEHYKGLFVQRIPRYAVQLPGTKGWNTRKFPLHDTEILKHLDGRHYIGCLSRWYPEFAALDLDHMDRNKVEEIRSGLLLDEANSALFSSPSKDSYHIYFRPQYNGKPPTISLLQIIIKPYAKAKGIEIYPQKNRAFRLPFGLDQRCLDFEKVCLESWKEKMAWLEKKDDFDLSTVKGHQTFFDFQPTDPTRTSPGEDPPGDDLLVNVPYVTDLLKNGLQGPSSRDRAQFEIIRHLWRQNVKPDDAWRTVWEWIQKMHNGYSKDFLKHPGAVRDHIRHQVSAYYNRMEYRFKLPDRTHLSHKGYICEPDLVNIVELCAGNLPRMRFTFELVKFMNPRRHREVVPVHSDKLIQWSSWKTYQRHLEYLDGKGILERGSGYLVGEKSKSLKLRWPYKTEHEAVLFGGRAIETLEGAVKILFKPTEFRELLGRYVKRTTALMTIKTLFEGVKKGETYNT